MFTVSIAGAVARLVDAQSSQDAAEQAALADDAGWVGHKYRRDDATAVVTDESAHARVYVLEGGPFTFGARLVE